MGCLLRLMTVEGNLKAWPCKVGHVRPVVLFNPANIFMIKGLRSDLSGKCCIIHEIKCYLADVFNPKRLTTALYARGCTPLEQLGVKSLAQ